MNKFILRVAKWRIGYALDIFEKAKRRLDGAYVFLDGVVDSAKFSIAATHRQINQLETDIEDEEDFIQTIEQEQVRLSGIRSKLNAFLEG